MIASRDHVRLLSVTFISSNLRLDRHASIVSVSCFYWLRQLWRSRRSLDRESSATLVHALDYCNAVLAGAPKNDGQVATNVKRRSSGGQQHKQVDRGLSRLLHTELHWLDVSERVAYKLSVMRNSCMHDRAPQYLMDFFHPASSVASRQQLRSASRRLPVVPSRLLRCRLTVSTTPTFMFASYFAGQKFSYLT